MVYLIQDCRVPKSNVLGEVGKGYKIAIETLNEGRIAIGGQMLGLAQGAFDHALAYTKQRKQFGKLLQEHQGIQFQLAEMATKIEAARLLVFDVPYLLNRASHLKIKNFEYLGRIKNAKSVIKDTMLQSKWL